MRRVGFVAAIAMAAALATSLALAWALASGWQRGWLVRQIQDGAASALGVPVAIGALEGNLLREVALRDLRIGAADAPLVEVREAVLRLDLRSSLLGRELVADALRIAGVRITATRDAMGRWNIEPLLDADEEPESRSVWAPAVRVRSFALDDAQLSLLWEAGGTPARVAMSAAATARELRFPLGAGGGAAPELHVEVQLEPAPVGRARLDTGRLALALDPTGLVTVRGDARGSFGGVSIDGSGRLPEPGETRSLALQTNLALAALDLGAVSGEPALATRLDGRAQLAYALPLDADSPPGDLRFDLALDRSQLAIGALRSARVRGALAGERWQLEEVSVDAEALSIAASGSGARDTIESLDLQAKAAELARLAPWLPDDLGARGALSIQARLSGALPLPDGHVSLAGSKLRLRGTDLGALVAEVSSQQHRIAIGSLELRGGELPLRVDPGAVVAVRDDGVATDALSLHVADQHLRISGFASRSEVRELKVSFDHLDVGALWGRFAPRDYAVGGVLDGKLAVDGPLPVPRGSGDLEWRRPRWGTIAADQIRVQVVSDERAVRGELHGGGGSLGRLDAKLALPIPAASRDGAAWLDEPGTSLELSGQSFDLAALAPFLPEPLDHPAGRATFELRLRGALAKPVSEGRLEIAEGSVRVMPKGLGVAPIRARLAWSDRVLRIESLELGHEGARLNAAGSLRVPDLRDPLGSDADLRITVANLAVRSLAALGDAGDALPQDGILGADLAVRGELRQPAVTGTVNANRLRWQGVDIDAIAVELALRERDLEAHMRMRHAGAEVLRGRALLPLHDVDALPDAWLRDPRARLELRGDDLDLALLEPFLPELLRKPRGRAQLELVATGSEPEPELTGSLRVSDGSVRAPLLGQTFAPIAGTAHLTQGALQIDGVSIGAPGQSMLLRGRVGLAALRPADVDLNLTLDHFPLSRSSALETNVNGQLAATGSVDAPHLAGNLVLDRASLTLGRSDPVLKELRIVGGTQQSGVAVLREREDRGEGFLARGTADVGFAVPRGTWVRSDDASFEVEGNVRVTKRARDAWRWTGQASVVRGTYDLHNIVFEVRRGRVEFTGGSELDPTLDVVAEHDVGSVTILAVLSGRLSAPVLKLESEPAMPESDVIAYLLFGRPASELGDSQQSGVDHAAIAMAAGMAAAELQRMFGKDLPFDTLDVRPERTGGGQIGFGKYLSRNVFVRYGHSVGDETNDEVQVEWRINERWSIQNTLGRRTSGADIVFGIDY